MVNSKYYLKTTGVTIVEDWGGGETDDCYPFKLHPDEEPEDIKKDKSHRKKGFNFAN